MKFQAPATGLANAIGALLLRLMIVSLHLDGNQIPLV